MILYKLLLIIGVWGNMNGQYKVASGIDQNVPFETDFIKRGFEYFDVYSQEISTHYAQVYWTDQPPQSLPQHIIERFSNRVLVITGYEIDQVFAHPDENISLPITWVYNHHCGIMINGEYNLYGIPTMQEFSEGNGGEFRKSYHGYPSNYGQLIFSPKTYIAMPMSIDTRNRECGISVQDIDKCVNENMFGPEPLQSKYGREHKTNVSGLIHCPCTGSYGGDPVIYGNMTATKSGTLIDYTLQLSCDVKKTLTYNECVDIGKHLGIVDIVKIDTNDMPPNCILVRDRLMFNSKYESKELCFVDQYSPRIGSLVNKIVNVNLSVVINASMISISMNGSDTGWFAVGFGAQKMNDMPWTIVIFPNGSFQERRIGECTVEGRHCQGIELDPVLQIDTQYRESGVLSVRLNGNINYIPYKINTNLVVPVILARGYNDELVYHRVHQTSELLLISDEVESICICKTNIRGLCDSNGNTCSTFYKDCIDDLSTTLNPTCTSDTYAGGLACCSHGTYLLDQWQIHDTQVLRYYLKWRFYFDDNNYTTSNYTNLIRLYAQTEAYSGEYDVPPAYADVDTPQIIGYYDWPMGTPTQGTKCDQNKCHHVLTRRFTLSVIEPVELIMISGHCHAPRCARMELWMVVENITKLLCVQIPIFGKGIEKQFDEAGYIAIPPCLFGTEPYLKPPPRIFPDNELISIKYTENTYNGNYGEMASWQMRGAILRT